MLFNYIISIYYTSIFLYKNVHLLLLKSSNKKIIRKNNIKNNKVVFKYKYFFNYNIVDCI